MRIHGKVIHGKEKGRTIGFPTVNLQPEADFCMPEIGVYASKVYIYGLPASLPFYIGITNIGQRPTADNENNITIETHILDFDGDIYGYTIDVEIIEKIREIRKFASMEELGRQLAKDCQTAKKMIK